MNDLVNFKNAGATLSLDGWHKNLPCLKWIVNGQLTPCDTSQITGDKVFNIDQVLNATNAHPPAQAIDVGSGEWNCEGLPPVGTRCHVYLAGCPYLNSLITYQGKDVGCYEYEGKEYSFATRDAEFRPIQSERDKVISNARHVIAAATREAERDGIFLGVDGHIAKALEAVGMLKLPED